MRKALLFALTISLCLGLTACGGEAAEEQAREVQLRFQELSAAGVEVELTCHYGGEVRDYALRCEYTPGESTVEVLAPEELKGISAVLAGEALTLAYDDILLDAGAYSGTEMSPLWAVPAMLRAMGEGYPLESAREEVEGTACLRVTFETTDSDGEKRYTAIWFDEGGIPLRGEITAGETVVYTAVFTQFTPEETDHGAAAEENLGGD